MRAVLQRVSRAQVVANGKVTGRIGHGILVFLGVQRGDTDQDLEWLAAKLPRLRCFEDEAGRMNLNLQDVNGEALVISQFTLFGNLKKGSRPSFNRAADPEMAIPMYERFIELLSEHLGKPVPSGIFGAMMEIEAINDGPVTLLLDTRDKNL